MSNNRMSRLGDRTRKKKPIATASGNVLVHHKRAARVGDTTADGSAANKGAAKVLANNRNVHRVEDAHDDWATITGALKVLVGDFDGTFTPPPTPPIAEVLCEHTRTARVPGQVLDTVAKLDHDRKKLANEHAATIGPAGSPGTVAPSGRIIRNETAAMLDDIEPVDVVTVRLLRDADKAPGTVQVKRNGHAYATPGKSGGAYKFQASCLFADSIPFLWGFWTKGTVYEVVGLAEAIRVHSRSAHMWEVALKTPDIFKQKTGDDVDKKFADKRVERPFELEYNREVVKVREFQGWKPWQKAAPTATLEGTSKRKAGRLPKPETHTYDTEAEFSFLTIKRDGEEFGFDNRIAKALDEFIRLAMLVQGWYDEVINQIPKWGWYASFEWSILRGEIIGEAEWKEIEGGPATWLRLAGHFKIVLFEATFKFCFGFEWRSYTLQAFAGVQGCVEIDLGRERMPPPSEPTFDIKVCSKIEGMLGIEAKAGKWAELQGKATVGFELSVTFSLGECKKNPGRQWISGALKWLSPKAIVKVSTRVGIDWSKEWRLGDYVKALDDHELVKW